MKRFTGLILSAALALSLAAPAFAIDVIEVTPEWVVLVPESPTEYEKFAAEKLVSGLSEYFGSNVSTATEASGRYIAIGSAGKADISGVAVNGYRISAIEGNIHICGNGTRGLQTGVYRFLEEFCGRKVYSAEITVTGKGSAIPVPGNTDIVYEPYFEYADTDWRSPCNTEYSMANGLSGGAYRSIPYEMGGTVDYLGGFCHTMGAICETAKYAESNPEYLALHDGERTADQPCLTNPDVLEIAIRNVLKILEERHNPDAPLQIVSVTQNDNYSNCQCENCKAFEDAHGGVPSATVLNFANLIADAVKEAGYDNVAIDTLAYLYSQAAPENIVPRDNVIIRLCPIFCCYAHTIDSKCNKDFMKDLEDWSKICERLYIWSYATNYAHTCAVFPDFGTTQRNIQIFYEHNVKGIYVEGNYYVRRCDTEFSDLRAYMISKCLQNPYCDIDAEIDGFLDTYYGPGGKYMRKIFDIFVSHAGSYDNHLAIYYGSWSCMRPLSTATAMLLDRYWKQAKEAAETEEQTANIERSELSWRWWKSSAGKLEFSFFKASRGDENEKLYDDMMAAGVVILNEGGKDVTAIDRDVVRYVAPDHWHEDPAESGTVQTYIKIGKLTEKFPPLFGIVAYVYNLIQS